MCEVFLLLSCFLSVNINRNRFYLAFLSKASFPLHSRDFFTPSLVERGNKKWFWVSFQLNNHFIFIVSKISYIFRVASFISATWHHPKINILWTFKLTVAKPVFHFKRIELSVNKSRCLRKLDDIIRRFT